MYKRVVNVQSVCSVQKLAPLGGCRDLTRTEVRQNGLAHGVRTRNV